MFVMTPAQRWRPGWPLLSALLALSIFLALIPSTLMALRGPRLLGYQAAPTSYASWWRVTSVWPASFAWDAGLRPGTLLRSTTPPVTRGATVVQVWTGRCCRTVTIPPRGATMPEFAWLELALAAAMLTIGTGTMLFARVRRPALLLLLVCLTAALGLCGVAAFEYGAPWGGMLFDLCWFAMLPPLMLLLATHVPPGGRTLVLGWRLPVLMIVLLLVLDGAGFVEVSLYTPTRNIEGAIFVLAQALAAGIWLWRARAARQTPHWPEYRLVLLGLGGAFGGIALLAVVPTMAHWRLPWPPEAASCLLLLFPAVLAWVLLRYRLLGLRLRVQRAAITACLLGGIVCLGLLLANDGLTGLDVIVVILLAGLGVPVVQRGIDRLFPDGRAAYAALVQRSGEQLNVAVEMDGLAPIMEDMRRGLGLTGLAVRRGERVLAQVGMVDPACAHRFRVHHGGTYMAALEAGDKLYDDDLLPADREALAVFCQQLGAFLAGQELVLRLQETVVRLEETQRRLLTAHRRERERLSRRLHQGPLQDAVVVQQSLPPESPPAVAAAHLETSLRAILTDTASGVLRDLGLPAAIRGYVAYLTPAASSQGCMLTTALDECAADLADDEAFALYQLAHEALANAVRHSQCRQVDLRLRVEGAMVLLDVRDDGCGLPSGWEQARVDHRGLRDALDLVRAVRGATATAEALSPCGTIVQARLPWRTRVRCGEEDGRMQSGDEDKVTIVIAEDHAVLRQGLRRLLGEDERLLVVAEARTGYEILGLVMQQQPDVLLLDLDLPGQSGLEALRAVREHIVCPPRVLVLSAFQAEEYIARAYELGVAGFLGKGSCDGERLRAAIHRIMAGETVFDPAVAAIARRQSFSTTGRFRRYSDGSRALTRAEREVLRGMLEGQSYQEIAAALGRERGTVRSQANAVFDKLDVSNRGQAVRKALQLGILQTSDQPDRGDSQTF